MSYYWSNFVHSFSRDGLFCLFHTLNFNAIFTPYEIAVQKGCKISETELSTWGNPVVSLLLEHEFIKYLMDEEKNYFEEISSKSQEIKLTDLRLLISNNCNMKCDYCQIERNLDKRSRINMPIEVARKAINYFLENSSKRDKLTVNLTGGEPLLNLDTVRFVIDYVKSKNPAIRLVMFTNGTLLTNDIAKYLSQNNVFTIVSIDGPPDVHNKCRRFSDGAESYAASFAGYQCLVQNKVICGISTVIRNNNEDFKKTLEWLMKIKPLSVGMNYQHSLINQQHDVDFKNYNKQIIYAHQVLSEQNILLENYERYNKCFLLGKMKEKECQACGHGITVDSRGKVGPCKSLLVSDIICYDLETFDVFTNETFQAWAKRTPLNHAGCRDCFAIAICGGGCAYDSYLIHGDSLELDTRLCVHMKGILLDIIWNKCNTQSINEKGYYVFKTDYNALLQEYVRSVGH